MRVAGECPGDDGAGVGVKEVEEEEEGSETDDGGGFGSEAGRVTLSRLSCSGCATDGEVDVGEDGEDESNAVPSAVIELRVVGRVRA